MATTQCTRIEALRTIVAGGTAKVDGIALDATTANMLVTVYDALRSDANKAKFETIPLRKLIDFGWKQVR
jgi:hypothetical protein